MVEILVSQPKRYSINNEMIKMRSANGRLESCKNKSSRPGERWRGEPWHFLSLIEQDRSPDRIDVSVTSFSRPSSAPKLAAVADCSVTAIPHYGGQTGQLN